LAPNEIQTETTTNMTSKIFISILIVICNYSAYCQSNSTFIKRVKSYRDHVKLKRQNRSKDFLIDTSTFNLSTYFGMFDKLVINPNKKLYYAFCDYGTYGQPALYVKHDSLIMENYIEQYLDKIYGEIGMHKTKIKEEINDFRRNEILFGFAEDPMNKARNNITPDDSKIGYLQYLYFYLFGENFALKWHSNYGKGNVIFSKEEMKRLYDYYKTTDDFTFEEKDLEEVKKLLSKKFKPKIKLTNKNCTISWYENYLHDGFYKMTYDIERQAPFRVEKKEEIKIASPKYGLVY
jgi:hypothetical protein